MERASTCPVRSSQTNIHLPRYEFGKNIKFDITAHTCLPCRHIRVSEGARNNCNRDAQITEISDRQACANYPSAHKVIVIYQNSGPKIRPSMI